ncbi:CGNR zinc finger domain-containing protein [Thermopolyspora sp. NPDC052614]|uniref:CGNR zinc finger domain-containing protein n=1 Tax=Thermopolyspora sp. NPDC052614 TaxID=3155682 RepID=UPI0034216ED2
MGFVFVSGNLALDLAGTLKWRRAEPEELLVTPGDLARWSVEAGIATEEPSLDAEGLRRLRALREAVYRLVTGALRGGPWPEDDLRVVNEEARGAPPRLTLTPAGLARRADIEAIASAVARSAAELLGELRHLRVRECARPECTRIFVDRSRGGNRQWCGMEECGNRIKAANYRARRNRAAASG